MTSKKCAVFLTAVLAATKVDREGKGEKWPPRRMGSETAFEGDPMQKNSECISP